MVVKAVAVRSNTEGSPSRRMPLNPSAGVGGVDESLLLTHSLIKCAGSAIVMPKNMANVKKTGNFVPSISPVKPSVVSPMAALQKMVQNVPAKSAMRKTAAAAGEQDGSSPPP